MDLELRLLRSFVAIYECGTLSRAAERLGCTQAAMEELRDFCQRELHLLPRQVQLFTPTPCTWSTLMYWTETDPFTGAPCFVEKSEAGRERQKAVITGAAERRPPPPARSGLAARKRRKP